MAEGNGTNRLDDHEQRLTKLQAARRELEDSFIVMTHLETKAAARIKEHAEFIAGHEEWMKHMQDKMDALTSIIMRREGGSEASQ